MGSRPRYTLPDVGIKRPAMILRSVDLPHPDGPTSVRNSPFRTFSDTFCNATKGSPFFSKTWVMRSIVSDDPLLGVREAEPVDTVSRTSLSRRLRCGMIVDATVAAGKTHSAPGGLPPYIGEDGRFGMWTTSSAAHKAATTLPWMADTSLRQPPGMMAAELTGDRTLRLARRPLPEPPSGWVIVRVAAAGVCGTELHFLEGLLDPRGETRVLGHEVAGTVCDPATGPGGRGERAAVYNVLNCRACRYCRSNRDRLCERSNGMIGFTIDGGFAEYVAVPEANLVPLPETVSFEAGAVLACSGMTAVHAVRLAGIGIGDPVVVNGVGGVGLMLIQVAALAGAAVLAVADDPAKLDLAESLGARARLLIDHPQGYEDMDRQARGSLGRAPDVFFETVGTRETMQAGFNCLAPGGAFVQIGYTSQPLDIHPGALIRNELRILTSAAGSKNDLETAISLAAQGQLEVVIANRTDLNGLSDAIQGLRDRRVLGRNVIRCESG